MHSSSGTRISLVLVLKAEKAIQPLENMRVVN